MRQRGPIGDLAGELHCDRSNVSRLVDRTSNRGLIQRGDQESDGRVTVIELTPDGQRVAHHLLTTFASKLEPLLSTWSAERQEAAVQTLTELAEALEDVTRPTAAPVPPGR
jgi:DNA-binding MarR family transcriptional regulator